MKTAKYAALVVLLISLSLASRALAHCDSMDGPVIKDAQRALQSNDLTPVLKWVSAKDERTVRQVFDLIASTRGESEAAQKIADNYFFETLVRIHRASEGEGFTGLKPTGSVEPAIAATDRALAEGDIEELADKIAAAVRDGIKKRFNEAYEKKSTAEDSIVQGREYVEAYVQLTHFIEAIHHTVSHGASHKHQEGE
jgi:hypothetical protein